MPFYGDFFLEKKYVRYADFLLLQSIADVIGQMGMVGRVGLGGLLVWVG